MDAYMWNAITTDIERDLQGDGYHIAVWLVTDAIWQGAWRPTSHADVIAIERDDGMKKLNPIYIPLSSIVAVKKVEP
jgi:hypothetical protein